MQPCLTAKASVQNYSVCVCLCCLRPLVCESRLKKSGLCVLKFVVCFCVVHVLLLLVFVVFVVLCCVARATKEKEKTSL